MAVWTCGVPGVLLSRKLKHLDFTYKTRRLVAFGRLNSTPSRAVRLGSLLIASSDHFLSGRRTAYAVTADEDLGFVCFMVTRNISCVSFTGCIHSFVRS